MKKNYEPYGILLVDKNEKITSHDVVDIIRKKLNIKKVGHTGTLDPLATGLLIILVGKSTSKQQNFQKLDKIYEGKILFGLETDTWDIEGKILNERKIEFLEKKSLEEKISILSGTINLKVPPYSAVKYQGQTLYRLARKNKVVPEITKKMSVKWLDYKLDKNTLYFKIKCSSGTYLRSIAHTLGLMMGVGGVIKELRRLQIGDYSVEDANKISEIKNMDKDSVSKLLIK